MLPFPLLPSSAWVMPLLNVREFRRDLVSSGMFSRGGRGVEAALKRMMFVAGKEREDYEEYDEEEDDFEEDDFEEDETDEDEV